MRPTGSTHPDACRCRDVNALLDSLRRRIDELEADVRSAQAHRAAEVSKLEELTSVKGQLERRLEDARAQVERAQAMARPAGPPPSTIPAMPSSPTTPPNALSTRAAGVTAVDHEFWHQDSPKPWNRRLPAALLAQLIGAVVVLALILARLA